MKKDLSNIEIGLRIKAAREDKGMTKSELASKVGVADSTIKRYEDGEIATIKLPVIESISNALQINPLWVVGKSDVKDAHYYVNEEARKIAQELHDNPELKILFDASRDVSPEDLLKVADLIRSLKKID